MFELNVKVSDAHDVSILATLAELILSDPVETEGGSSTNEQRILALDLIFQSGVDALLCSVNMDNDLLEKYRFFAKCMRRRADEIDEFLEKLLVE